MGFSTNFYLGYYYCQTTTTPLTSCTFLGQTYVTDNFGHQTGRYYTSPQLTLPQTAVWGTGYVRFVADSTGVIKEAYETNNTRNDAIYVSTRPDLTVSAVTPPTGSIVTAGATFTASMTVSNKFATSAVNKAAATSWYLCPGKTTSGCTLLGAKSGILKVNSGSTTGAITSGLLTVPASYKQGAAFLRAYVDSGNAVSETNEGNNNGYGAVTVVPGTPDLTFANAVAVNSGSAAMAGATFTSRAWVRNASLASLKTDFYLHFHYCTSTAFSSCTQLGSTFIKDDFAGNQIRAYTSAALTMPTSVVAGTGYIRFTVDATGVVKETKETNNKVLRAVKVTKLPDLAFTAGKVPATGSAAKAGDSFTAAYTLANGQATSAFSTNFAVAYALCPGMSSSGCVALGLSSVTQDFVSGGTLALSSPSLTIPKGTKPGTYYVQALADSTGKVAEGNEANNARYDMITVGGAPKADLYVQSLTASEKSGVVSYSLVACNLGAAMTKGFNLGLFYNRTLAPTCGATADKTWAVPALAKGGCSTKTLVRTNVKPGAYLDWAMADSGCSVAESSETNNTKSVAYTVKGLTPDQGIAVDSAVITPDAGVAEAGPAEAGVADMALVDSASWDLPAGDMAPVDTGMTGDLDDASLNDADMAGTADLGEDLGGGDLAAGDLAAGDGATGDTGASGDQGPGVDAVLLDGPAASGDKGTTTDPVDEGCDCSAGAGDASGGLGLMLLLGLALLLRRRRR